MGAACASYLRKSGPALTDHGMVLFVIRELQANQTVAMGSQIHRIQPVGIQGRRQPNAGRGHRRPESFGATESLQLSAGRQGRTHELRFVVNPQGIVVQERKVDRPLVAAHAVTSHERPREQHVLSPDEDRLPLRVDIPVVCRLPTHEYMNGRPVPIQESGGGQVGDPPSRVLDCLLHEHAHGQAIHQPPRCDRLALLVFAEPSPEPADDRHRGLAEPRGNLNKLRQRRSLGEFPLEGEGRIPNSFLEEVSEVPRCGTFAHLAGRATHLSLPSSDRRIINAVCANACS